MLTNLTKRLTLFWDSPSSTARQVISTSSTAPDHLAHVMRTNTRQSLDLSDTGIIVAERHTIRPNSRFHTTLCLVVRMVTCLYQIINTLACCSEHNPCTALTNTSTVNSSNIYLISRSRFWNIVLCYWKKILFLYVLVLLISWNVFCPNIGSKSKENPDSVLLW